MKSFYGPAVPPACLSAQVAVLDPMAVPSRTYIHTRARIAVYDAVDAAPRVEEIDPGTVPDYIDALSTRVYELSQAVGGSVPYTVIRELAENFIHADFAEPVVSVLDCGSSIRFADQGPGIPDKDRAVQPGFTTAKGDMKRYIRGVGSGLPLVREYLSTSGGSLVIEDNLGSGSVVTIQTHAACITRPGSDAPLYAECRSSRGRPETPPVLPELPSLGSLPRLTTRQKQVLALVLESGAAGPSLVAKELGVGISTAYRDLASLEEMGLISADAGKRNLTPSGLSYLDALSTI